MSIILYNFLFDALFAAFAATGFAMVFNVPRKTLIYCFFGGAITYTSRSLFMHFDFQIEIATLLASTLIGTIAYYWSRKFLIPRPIYTVASIIPLLPGTYAFTAVISLINMNTYGVTPDLIVVFFENGLKAVSILAAITFGLVIPSLVFFRYNRDII